MSTEAARVPLRLRGSVVMRPESFGALLYDFDTRRLSFVKDTRLAAVLASLAEHDDATSAITAAGVPADEVGRFAAAIDGLRASGVIERRAA